MVVVSPSASVAARQTVHVSVWRLRFVHQVQSVGLPHNSMPYRSV